LHAVRRATIKRTAGTTTGARAPRGTGSVPSSCALPAGRLGRFLGERLEGTGQPVESWALGPEKRTWSQLH